MELAECKMRLWDFADHRDHADSIKSTLREWKIVDVRRLRLQIRYSFGLRSAPHALDHLGFDVDRNDLPGGADCAGCLDGVSAIAGTNFQHGHAWSYAVAAGHVKGRLGSPSERIVYGIGQELWHRELVEVAEDSEERVQDD